jgi:hypothetical protein
LPVVLAASLGACSGPDQISLGGHLTPLTERFLSPAGSDENDGSMDRPWKTFAYALPRLAPGSTLQLLSDDATPATPYDASTSGTLNVRCGAASPTSPAPNAVFASNGQPGMPITVRAYSEHGAFVRGDGHVPPITIDGCHDWGVAGLRVEAQDAADDLTTPDTGSVVVLVGKNANVTLTRLLARRPNRQKSVARVIRIADGSSGVTVVECELYDFHGNGIEAARSDSLVLQRNYINSRNTPDAPGAATEDPARGDWGVWLEETTHVYAENNIVENVYAGFGVVGRGPDVAADVPALFDPVSNNQLLGNVVNQPSGLGFRLDGRCQGVMPCDATHTVHHTVLDNDVVIGGALGVSDAGSVDTKINQMTILQAARSIQLKRERQNAGTTATSSVTNTLMMGFQSTAFEVLDEASWGCDHCAAVGGYAAAAIWAPDGTQQVTKVDADPSDLGACLVYLPMSSRLRRAGTLGQQPVGANVLRPYDNSGSLISDMSLWSPSAFPCGAIVTGVNSDPATSCTGAAARLHVGFAFGCPLPQ